MRNNDYKTKFIFIFIKCIIINSILVLPNLHYSFHFLIRIFIILLI